MTDETILLKILAACERTAAACERLADVADARHHARQQAPLPRLEAPRQSTNDKDILTVTGNVLHFGVFCGRDGQPKTTKKGNEYWKLKLSTGFEAMVFSSSQAATCQKADAEGRPLIVDYVISGKYSNIEDVKIGTGFGRGRVAVEEEDSEGQPF